MVRIISVTRCRGIVMAFAGALLGLFMATPSPAAQAPAAPSIEILYPKPNSVVGSRVNVVLDPASRTTASLRFQVFVGSMQYPVIDPSSGMHAVQGLVLDPGVNTITVKALASADPARGSAPVTSSPVVASRSLTVYSREGISSSIPAQYRPSYFHSRSGESGCLPCHRLEAGQRDQAAAKPQDVLCYACHRNIPATKYMHGPTAVWNCLSCHDSEAEPVKYQFSDAWKVSTTTHAVQPALFTIPADALFKPQTAVLLSDAVPAVPKDRKLGRKRTQELVEARKAEIKKRKSQQRKLFQELFSYLAQNPGERVRIESHADGALYGQDKGQKGKGSRNAKRLTDARAKAVAKLLRDLGIKGKNRLVAVGMGASPANLSETVPDAPGLNDRIVLVAYPPQVKVLTSRSLPELKDRERVTVHIDYSRCVGTIRDLRVIERLPRGRQYGKGSALFRGTGKEPRVAGDELVWNLGDVGADFHETLTFLLRKRKGASAKIDLTTKLRFTVGGKDETRTFDNQSLRGTAPTVREICDRCHQSASCAMSCHGPLQFSSR